MLIAVTGKLNEGYFQGMNSFVGMLMLVGCDEYESYAVALFFYLKVGYYEIFRNGFSKLFTISETIEKMVKIHLPDIHQKLTLWDVQLNTVTLKWLVTMFSEFVSQVEVKILFGLFCSLGEFWLISLSMG